MTAQISGSGDTTFSNNVHIGADLNLTGASPRITGDFSNASPANRTLVKTSTTNGSTTVGAVPNGTSTSAGFAAFNAADPTNSSHASVEVSSTEASIRSGKSGTGSYLPLSFYTEDWRYMQISGNKISLSNIPAGLGWDASTPAIDMLIGKALWSDGVTNYSGNNLYRPQAGGTTYRNSGKAALITESYQNGTINLQIFPAGFAGTAVSTPVTSFGVDSNGNALLSTPNGGLGYGDGAGGTVTQLLGKSATVTLNKPSGEITMHNATMAAGESIVFQLNNSCIGPADILTVNSNYSNAPAAYVAQCIFQTSGYAYIQVTNITTGSRSDAITLVFTLQKGSTT